MCGIAGIVGDASPDALWKMAAALKHRGPDDSGVWIAPECNVGLAHTRLSILDLSPAGHQPMLSDDQNSVLVFNGEIYNHLEIRRELGNRETWKGHSDTETLLRAIHRWGFDAAIPRCRGMFAMAFYDARRRVLSLARDRMGEKPLYYGWNGRKFFFASDLRAMEAHPDFSPGRDVAAVRSYLRFGYIPSPLSIYEGILKLPPGHIFHLPLEQPALAKCVPYWNLREVFQKGTHAGIKTLPEAKDALRELLELAVQEQQIADVPVGTFLSGGTDSSLITALMCQTSSKRVHTFTIGFEERDHNEAAAAREVASFLETEHEELILTPSEVLAEIPNLSSVHSEPFCDPSQIPTLLVSRLARRSVTVSLSGDGGDELFAGYTRYRFLQAMGHVPSAMRRLAASLLDLPSPRAWDLFAGTVNRIAGKRAGSLISADRASKMSRWLGTSSPEQMYLELLSQWPDHSDSSRADLSLGLLQELREDVGFPRNLMVFDALTYLPNDVLCKVDRAAMFQSLETRVPLLDHRIVELAASIPLSLNLGLFEGKKLLRSLLGDFLPAHMVDRPKKGFAVPIAAWLRGPLREWAEDLLSENALVESGLENGREIRIKWMEHLSGNRNWHYQIWNILMFQCWARRQ